MAAPSLLLYLEFRTNSESYFFELMRLPDGSRKFAMSFSRTRIRLALTYYFLLGVLNWNHQAILIEDMLRNRTIKLPKFRILLFWQANIMKRLLSQQCQIELIVVYNHSFDQLSTLMDIYHTLIGASV
jgi:hypothetical protein